VKLFIHDHGEAVYFADVVTVLGFIQNHRQGWSASASGLEENPDGADFLPLEVLEQNLFSLIRDGDHKLQSSFQMDCLKLWLSLSTCQVNTPALGVQAAELRIVTVKIQTVLGFSTIRWCFARSPAFLNMHSQIPLSSSVTRLRAT
jgi:hypothetical protein